jgi:hypothetical protein
MPETHYITHRDRCRAIVVVRKFLATTDSPGFGLKILLALLGKVIVVLVTMISLAFTGHDSLDPRMRPMGTGLDLVGRRADGTTFPVDIMLNPLKHLVEPMVLAVVRDMTDRRAAEEAAPEPEDVRNVL